MDLRRYERWVRRRRPGGRRARRGRVVAVTDSALSPLAEQADVDFTSSRPTAPAPSTATSAPSPSPTPSWRASPPACAAPPPTASTAIERPGRRRRPRGLTPSCRSPVSVRGSAVLRLDGGAPSRHGGVVRPTGRTCPTGWCARSTTWPRRPASPCCGPAARAADAAVATSAVLAVTTPAHVRHGRRPVRPRPRPPAARARRAQRRRAAPAAAPTPTGCAPRAHDVMPFRGDIRTAPVPGCVDGWLALHERFGRLPLADVLGARRSATPTDGFPASPLLAVRPRPAGRRPRAPTTSPRRGRCRPATSCAGPASARPSQAIAADGPRRLLRGRVRRRASLAARRRRVHRRPTSPARRPTGSTPLGLDAWGHDVWTVPPNSQGYLTLAGRRRSPSGPAAARRSRRRPRGPTCSSRRPGPPATTGPPCCTRRADGAALLLARTARRARRRRDRPGPTAATSLDGTSRGGTIYLCAVDGDGMGVSPHPVERLRLRLPRRRARRPAIFLQNRGIGFSLEPGHPAEYGPGRRPPTRCRPALVTGPDGALRAVIGTMGGDSQPQILLQLLARLLRHGRSPGTVIGAPRWVARPRRRHRVRHLGRRRPGLTSGSRPDAPGGLGSRAGRRGHEVRQADQAHRRLRPRPPHRPDPRRPRRRRRPPVHRRRRTC